jgi:prepilin-type N-terminal cleavage/methylation domain-containing protein
MWVKTKNNRGFTIVELLVVVVVISILAAIGVAAFTGMKTKTLNTSRLSEITAWNTVFQAYKAQYGSYPPVAAGNYCLGVGFPDGDGIAGGECRDYRYNSVNTYHEVDATAVMTELKKVATLPYGSRTPVNDTVGPYINLWSTGYSIINVFQGKSSDCPAPTIYSWDDGNGRLLCTIEASS